MSTKTPRPMTDTEAQIAALLGCALSGAVMGFIVGWLVRGWA